MCSVRIPTWTVHVPKGASDQFAPDRGNVTRHTRCRYHIRGWVLVSTLSKARAHLARTGQAVRNSLQSIRFSERMLVVVHLSQLRANRRFP